jgi:acetyltransferase-like isoleucine patch superfamily enzyme
MPVEKRRAQRVSSILESLSLWIVTDIPGPLGDRLRHLYYRRKLRALAPTARIDVGVQISNPQFVTLGDNTWVDKYVVINAGPPTVGRRRVSRRQNPDFRFSEGSVVIGPNSHIAPHAVLNGHGGIHIEGDSTVAAGSRVYSLSHHHRNLDDPGDDRLYLFSSQAQQEWQSLLSAPVVIHRGGALALNSVILPGSTVGHDAWVTVGSVVMGEIPDGCIASGSPAEAVSFRPGYGPPAQQPS